MTASQWQLSHYGRQHQPVTDMWQSVLMTAVILTAALCFTAGDPVSRPKIKFENCGPPFEHVIMDPNPPRIRQMFNLTIVYFAAHDMVAGSVEIFVNIWPYHVKGPFCVDGASFDKKGCIFRKGERRTFSKSVWIDESFNEMDYYGNITVTNGNNQIMACIRGSFKLYRN